jgi:hypothetical protein
LSAGRRFGHESQTRSCALKSATTLPSCRMMAMLISDDADVSPSSAPFRPSVTAENDRTLYESDLINQINGRR